MAMLAGAIAYVAPAGARLATGITLNRENLVAEDAQPTGAHYVERHCIIDLQAAADAGCTPLWAAKRSRVRQSDTCGSKRGIDGLATTAAGNEASAAGAPKRARAGISVPHTAWVRPVDIAGPHP